MNAVSSSCSASDPPNADLPWIAITTCSPPAPGGGCPLSRPTPALCTTSFAHSPPSRPSSRGRRWPRWSGKSWRCHERGSGTYAVRLARQGQGLVLPRDGHRLAAPARRRLRPAARPRAPAGVSVLVDGCAGPRNTLQVTRIEGRGGRRLGRPVRPPLHRQPRPASRAGQRHQAGLPRRAQKAGVSRGESACHGG